MQNSINSVECNHDGFMRDSDLSKPCPGCGSRKYPIIGYRYPYEARQFLVMLIIISIVALAALTAGAIFVINIASQFSAIK